MARTNQPRSDFYALQARRQAESNARKTHMVKNVNKDGSVSKMAPTTSCWQLNAFGGSDAQAKAEARKAELERLNPGSRFTIVTL